MLRLSAPVLRLRARLTGTVLDVGHGPLTL